MQPVAAAAAAAAAAARVAAGVRGVVREVTMGQQEGDGGDGGHFACQAGSVWRWGGRGLMARAAAAVRRA